MGKAAKYWVPVFDTASVTVDGQCALVGLPDSVPQYPQYVL
jgi:hypothetical protein